MISARANGFIPGSVAHLAMAMDAVRQDLPFSTAGGFTAQASLRSLPRSGMGGLTACRHFAIK
jgi:hypothetical protein